ncbi:unnamed protein product [Lactuca saligna]|uniref:Uncharacterized protein n=1 Tax=Lactuca saligna TaxID=75948 RepID=A0AA36A454_LACSI|nr:unnamed protein product [Lactuca saligna]
MPKLPLMCSQTTLCVMIGLRLLPIVMDRSLKLVSESCYLPHPEKEEAGSEDAHFIFPGEQAIWVADGLKDPQLLALLHSQIRVLMLSTLVIMLENGSNIDFPSSGKTLHKPVANPKKLPKWNYDGWSTCQAPGEDSKVTTKAAHKV